MSSNSSATAERYIYMGHGTVPKNVTHVIVHESVTNIRKDAFRECRDLKEVVLPEGLRKIGGWAFSKCRSLRDINFPSTLRVIEDRAFEECSSLLRVDFNEGLRSIGEGAFDRCRSILHLKIPSTVITIDDCAFGYCFALKDVQLCEGLQKIGSLAFYMCYSLLRINIPSSVTTIGCGVFDYCNFLRNVAVAPDSALGQRELVRSCLLGRLQRVGCLLDSIKGRFDGLPLHMICFHQIEPATLLEEAKKHATKESLTQMDCLEMTPLHILACSGRHDVELYNFFVGVYPEALLIKDKWGETPLAYAILSEVPQDIIHFLFDKHSKSLNGILPFDFQVMIEKLATKKGTSAEFVRSIILAQRTHFPTLEIEWQTIVNDHIEGDMPVKVFRVLVEASVSKRANCMSPEHRLEIDNFINQFDAHDVDAPGRRWRDGERIIGRIRDYAQQHCEFLKNATTMLELALWNAAENATGNKRVHKRRRRTEIDELSPREKSRVSCGAGVIIPLVLPFL